jgi:hypothetical protein
MLNRMADAKAIDPADLSRVFVCDDPEEAVAHVTATAMKRFGLTYGPKVKPRWWLGEAFGQWWRSRFGRPVAQPMRG